ncbi:MAG: serine/threonine protein kinase [Labilithrix sp.]|nr:serine/threonine protein kinase [Labilithrix sp.]
MQVREITLTQGDGREGIVVVEKRLSLRERSMPEAHAHLAKETLLLRALGGDPTPRVVDAGADADGPFLRLARTPHRTLAARLAGPLDARWLERATRAAFAALASLHEATDADGPLGIVHADLSPSNLVIDDAGAHVVLLDLELAFYRDAPAPDGAFRGTARYCAPEIARGERPSVESDLFALAACFLHAHTGEPPRDAASLPALLAIAAEEPLAVPGHLDAALRACLAHERAARPRSARAVLAALC